MVSGLTLKSLIRVELGFVCDVRQWSDFFLFFFAGRRSVFLAPFSKETFVPAVYSWLLRHRLAERTARVYFPRSLSVPFWSPGRQRRAVLMTVAS